MKKNTKVAVSILIIIVISVGIKTLSSKSDLTTNSNSPIKVGSILILSGEGASWGEASKNGIDLAVQEINASGGINGRVIEVVHEDNMIDPRKALSAFKKLTELDKVSFIIGPNWSNSGLALRNVAKEKKVVMISPSLGMKEFNEDNEFLFNTWPHDFILSQNLAEYVYAKGHRHVALLGAQDVWVKDQTKAFKERFEALGGTISYLYEPKPDEKDLRSDIVKIKNDPSIDAVVLTNTGYSIAAISAMQLRDLSIKLPLYSITVDKKILSDCKGACDGMMYLTFLTPSADFEKKYRDKYKREVEIGADSAYDAMMMLADAMKSTQSTDPEIIARHLGTLERYRGESGNLISDGKRAFTKPYAVMTVVHGVGVPMK